MLLPSGRANTRCSVYRFDPSRSSRFFTCNSGLGARNGFGEPREREAKSTLSRPRPAAETARPAFETRENARKVRTIRQRPQNIGSHRTAWWAREDSKLQPDHYEWSARPLAACFSILMDEPECGALVGPGERNALEQDPDVRGRGWRPSTLASTMSGAR